MDGLTYFFMWCFSLCIPFLSKNVALSSGNIENDTFCMKILLPTQPFYSDQFNVATIDDKLGSVICPPQELKLILFECSKCKCNTTMEVYRECFGDTPFCVELSSCINCPFTYQCEKELQYYCPGRTFPTLKSTTSPPSTTGLITRSTENVTYLTIKRITTTRSTQTTGEDRELKTQKRIPYVPAPDTKLAVVIVCVLSVLCVIISSGGIYLYKRKRRRRQVTITETNAIPLMTTFTTTLSNAVIYPTSYKKEEINNMEFDTQKSCDSGVVCNVEKNHDE